MFPHFFVLLLCLLLSACVSQQSYTDQEQTVKTLQFDRIEAAKARLSLALSYLQNDNFNQAKFNLDKALEFAPQLAEVHYSRAFYFQQIGDMEQAMLAYEKSFELEPNNANVQHNYGSFLCWHGEYEKAKDLLIAAIKSPSYAEAGRSYLNLAYCNIERANYKQALKYLSLANKHEPMATDILLMASSLSYGLNEYKAALSWYNKYLQYSQDSVSSLTLGILIFDELGMQAELSNNQDALNKSLASIKKNQLATKQLLQQSEHWQLRQRINKR